MAEKTVRISQQQTKAITIVKWKIQPGVSVSIGRPLLLYKFDDDPKSEQRKLKSIHAGIVEKIAAQEGDRVEPGEVLLELEACCHPTIINDMCAECGSDLRKDNAASTASVPMVHAIPDLKVSKEVAQKLGRADNERLIRDRKLVLLVDLDQTLIHTTNDNIAPDIKDVYHFQLYGPNSPWYHTRLRPGTHDFLNNIYDFYELHICTFGARNYAHTIAMFLDNSQKYFSNRILSRDECFDPTSKKANLKSLFPCGDNMVCIIDDREDVWSHARNLIHVKPYHFFQHTGDINAPPGLDKHENDSDEGVDLSKHSRKHKDEQKRDKVEGAVEKKPEVICERKEQSDMKETLPDEQGKIEAEGDKKSTKKDEDKSDVNEKPNVDMLNNKEKNGTDEKLNEKDIPDKNNCKVNEAKPPDEEKQENNMIVYEDPDDYLTYLEDILKRIHKEFYEEFDKMESGNIPDLKEVIPKVRSSVLQGCHLVFSGLVPTHLKLEQSKAYQVARSLGAVVTQDFDENTTHLVAVRPGTAKVNAGKRKKNLKIVTPDWLWCCAERWEHADERVFPLKGKGSKNRHPPPHCSSPEHIPAYPVHDAPASRKRTPSGRFMDTINPLMSFSKDDIDDMDKEVRDILDDSDSSEDENKGAPPPIDEKVLEILNEESSSSEDFKKENDDGARALKRKHSTIEENPYHEDSTEDEAPSVKFRRGENIDDILDMEDTQESDNSLDPPDEVDDREWNMMGAALEREFLAD